MSSGLAKRIVLKKAMKDLTRRKLNQNLNYRKISCSSVSNQRNTKVNKLKRLCRLVPGKVLALALEFEAALQDLALVGEVWEEVGALLQRQLGRVHLRLLDAVPGIAGQPLAPEVDGHRVHPRVCRTLALDHLQIYFSWIHENNCVGWGTKVHI